MVFRLLPLIPKTTRDRGPTIAPAYPRARPTGTVPLAEKNGRELARSLAARQHSVHPFPITEVMPGARNRALRAIR